MNTSVVSGTQSKIGDEINGDSHTYTNPELRDKNGLTEAEFLAAYQPKDYPHPSLTADICVFRFAEEHARYGVQNTANEVVFGTTKNKLTRNEDSQNTAIDVFCTRDYAQDYAPDSTRDYAPDSTRDYAPTTKSHTTSPMQLLLIQRGGHPFLGTWATPGGFVNPDEDADHAAMRELAEETSLDSLPLEPVALYSTPGRDPRGWTISQAYVAIDSSGQIARAGDDAKNAAWFDVQFSSSGNPKSHSAAKSSELEGNNLLTLTHESTILTINFDVSYQAISGKTVTTHVVGHGLAFDHARIIADAYLLLMSRTN